MIIVENASIYILLGKIYRRQKTIHAEEWVKMAYIYSGCEPNWPMLEVLHHPEDLLKKPIRLLRHGF
jgi:hypothetical protein